MRALRRGRTNSLLGIGVAFALGVIFLWGGSHYGLGLVAGAVAFGAATVWALYRDEGAIYGLLLAALFEGLYKALYPSMWTMLVKDFFLAILWWRLIWTSRMRGDFSWARQPFTIAAISFTAYCLAQVVNPVTGSLPLGLAGLRTWILWMPAFYPFYAYFAERERIFRLVTILLLIMLPVSIYGIVQGNIGYEHTRIIPGFYELTKWHHASAPAEESGEAEGESEFEAGSRPIMNVRSCSIHISPGSFGAMSAILVLLSVGYWGWASTGKGKLLALVSGLAAAGGLLASGSRAPFLGLGIGALAMIIFARRRWALLTMALLMALVGAFFLQDIAGSGAVRLRRSISGSTVLARVTEPFLRGVRQGWQYPLGVGIGTGVGAGRLVYGKKMRFEGPRVQVFWAENEFGRALTELGFPGTALWLWLIGTALWQAGRGVRQLGTAREGLLAAGMFGGIMSVFAQLSVGSALYGAHGGLYYWIFGAAIAQLAKQHAAAAPDRCGALLEAEEGEHTSSPSLWRQPGGRTIRLA